MRTRGERQYVLSSSRHVVLRHRAEDLFHHREVLKVLVRLEERFAGNKLHEDTSNRPHVARVAPTQAEDDLRSAVMPSRNDGSVVVVVEGCAAEVDKLDAGIAEELARFWALSTQ
jgi:hypothetical protein